MAISKHRRWLRRCIAILATVVSIVITVWFITNLSNDESAAGVGRIYVSSFVVNGTDYGSGYYITEGPTWNEEYHFTDSENREFIFSNMDFCVKDTSKPQTSAIGLALQWIALLLLSAITFFFISWLVRSFVTDD